MKKASVVLKDLQKKLNPRNINWKNLKRIPMPKSYTPVLVFLLIIAAFLIGMLFTKIQYLEKNSATTGYTAPSQQGQGQAAVTPGAKVNVADGHFPVLGKKGAPIQIVEFADLRCPFCDSFFKDTEPQIIKQYVDTGKATFAFRGFAFLGPASTVAANAAECANEQGKFWAFHDYMYQNQPDESDTSMYNTDSLTTIAQNMGMNADQFRTCLSNNKYNNNVNNDYNDGTKAGVSGTPTTFVNGQAVVGAEPFSAFQTLIDQELAKK
ncbi:MAG: DsbA family protein [Candidatus Levyibacteriota bacterium]